MQKPTCDQCDKQFTIRELKTLKLNEDVEKVYFNCTHCDHEYVAYYQDNEFKHLQEEVRKLRSKRNLKQKQVHKLQKLTAKMKSKMESLKREHGTHF